jgi:hypothetical protein
MQLPDLTDILKMRPLPRNSLQGEENETDSNEEDDDEEQDNDEDDEEEQDSDEEDVEQENEEMNDDNVEQDVTAFTFVVEHLVGAIIGKKMWNKGKYKELVSEAFTASDEAFLYVILTNSYDMWKGANGSRVGAGTLTRDGTNKKYCGWTKQGIKMYNEMLKKVKENREAVGAKELEVTVRDAIKGRNPNAVNNAILDQARRRRQKRRRRQGDGHNSDGNDSDESIEAENDLSDAYEEV